MNSGELGQKTRRELLELAQKKKIHHYHAMTRGELVSSLSTIESPPQQQQIHTPKPAELPPIPQWYGKTRIVLLVRDPDWLFTYWEVTPQHWQEAEERIGAGAEQILRVYDLEGGFYDQKIHPQAHSWYLETGRPGHSFFVEIGLKAGSDFFAVARSNTVIAPPNTVSDCVDEAWLTVDELYRSALGTPGELNSEEFQRALGERIRWEMGSGAISSISSPVKIEAERGFWLVANTELILYGATEPGAEVTVAGEAVPLSEQGEFSLRFALADGTLTLPVVAERDGERITITPSITKRTD